MGVTADKVVVELEAKLDTYKTNVIGAEKQFSTSMAKIGSAANDTEKKVAHHATGVGAALKSIFDNTRLATIEEGTSRIRIFGSAVEALGPVGVGVAASLAAVFIALEQVKKALEVTDDIEKASAALGIGTTKLQEFDFIATATGVSVTAFRQALKAGNEALGAFQSNIGDARVKQAFSALGFTKEQLRGYNDIGELLPQIADKIKSLKSAAEQSKLAEALGLSAILPALRQGSAGFDDLTAKAHKYGLIIDEAMIKRGAEAKTEFEVLSKVISGNLTQAFVDLAPIIVGIVSVAADLARHIHDIVNDLSSIEHKSTDSLKAEYDANQREITRQLQAKVRNEIAPDDGTAGAFANDSGVSQGFSGYDKRAVSGMLARNDAIKTELAKAYRQEVKPTGGAKPLAPPHTEADDTKSLDAAAHLAAEKANHDYIEAMLALTVGISARAKVEKDIVDSDYAKQLVELDKQAAEIQKSKNDTNKTAQIEILNGARWEAFLTAQKKKELIDRQTADALREEALRVTTAQQQNGIDILQSLVGLTTSTKNRRDLSLSILDAEQKIERASLEEVRARATSTPVEKQIAEARLDMLDTLNANARSLSNRNNQTPLGAFAQQFNDHADAIDDQYSAVAAHGLQSLNDQLTDAILHSQTLGEALHNVFRSVLADLAKLEIEQGLVRPLANLLNGGAASAAGGVISFAASLFGGGRAAGGHVVAGVPYMTGENGPEPFIPSQSGRILPNGRAMSATSSGSRQVTMALTIDLKGANGDATIARIARQAAFQGSVAAHQQALDDMPGRLDSLQKLGT